MDNRSLILWKIPATQVAAFSNEIGLQQPFQLTTSTSLFGAATPTHRSRFLQHLESSHLGWLAERLFPEDYYVIADIGKASRLESGWKVEFKTMVNTPFDQTPRLYRFAAFWAQPGVDLLKIGPLQGALFNVNELNHSWQGSMATTEGGLSWQSKNLKRGKNLKLSKAYLDAAELTFAANGAAARYFYDGSSVSNKLTYLRAKNLHISNSFPWAQYLSPSPEVLLFDEKSEFLIQPITSEVASIAPGVGNCGDVQASSIGSVLFTNLIGCVFAQLPPEQVFAKLFATAQSEQQLLPDLPAIYFGVLDLYQALQASVGQALPKLTFSLFAQPKAIFINYEIKKGKVKKFERDFLPKSFKLAKVKFYPEQKEAVYAVSLNVYQAKGDNLDGYRAEWSTYVINPAEENPKPRFSVLEAQTNIQGFDPSLALQRYSPDIVVTPEILPSLLEAPADNFVYEMNDKNIVIEITDEEEQIEVNVNIAYPNEKRILHTMPTTDWMEANDFVYWGEVADILKYDQNVMFAELLVFNSNKHDIIKDNVFTGYVKKKPLPIILWNNKQDLALEPWGNLDSIVPEDE